MVAVQALRFGGVGIVVTAVHLAVALLLVALANIGPITANAAGFAVAVVVSYAANAHWTFERTGDHIRPLARFCLVAVLSVGLGTLIIYGTSALHWPYLASLLTVAAVAPAANFVIARYWVFASGPDDRASADIDFLVVVVSLCLAFWFYQGSMLNQDTSWYLVATERWLDGARLYRDIMEINPPLAFYLTAPPVFAASHSSLAPETAFFLWVFALILASLTWVQRLLSRAPQLEAGERHLLLAAAFLALVVTPMPSFGQREHLMVILALPLIFLVSLEPLGLRCSPLERAAIGAFGVMGIALKPYFLALPALLAFRCVIRLGSWRAAAAAEYLAIAAGCCIYLGFIAFVHPEYLTQIVPIGSLVYSAYEKPMVEVFLAPAVLMFSLIAGTIVAKPSADAAEREVGLRLLLAASAFVLAYLVQRKGWYHHIMPAQSCLCIVGAWVLATAQRRTHARALALSVVLAALVSTIIHPVSAGTYRSPWPPLFARFLPEGVADTSFLALAAGVSTAFPFANVARARSVSRYPCQWLIPGSVARLRQPEGLSDRRRRQLEEVVTLARRTTTEDFVKGRPDLVIVDDREAKPYFGGQDFDYIEFFMADPRFREQWSHYRKIARVHGLEIWRRVEEGSGS